MIETPHGFLTYGFNCVPGVSFPHVYIEDLYVVPSARKTHVATEMADRVADISIEAGVLKMIGSVSVKRNNVEANLDVLRRYGMKITAAQGDTIWLVKELV